MSIVDFCELGEGRILPFQFLVVRRIWIRFLLLLSRALAFGCSGYHCNDVLLESRGGTFKSAFAVSVNFVVLYDSLVHKILRVGDAATVVFVHLISYPLCPCFGLLNPSIGIKGM